MTQQEVIEIEPEIAFPICLKTTERDCPRCEAVLILNDNEQCYECLNCGYIDCGEED